MATDSDPQLSLRTRVLLSVQRALVGEVAPEVRAVSVDWSAKHIRIWLFCNGPVTEELTEDFDGGAVAQVVADFPDPDRGDPIVELRCVQCDAPEPLLVEGTLVYARKNERFRSV